MTIEHDPTSDAAYIHLRPDVAYAFGEDLDTARHIDYGADQRPLGVELLNVSAGVNLADLPEPDEIARLLAGAGNLTTTFGPEDIFHYVYAILHSPTYRTRYFELLKTDFPRVPLTHDLSLFRLLTVKGSQLVALHCPNTATSIPTTGSYPVSGSNIVEAGFPRYLSPREAEPGTGTPLSVGRVYINNGNPATGSNGQYFDGVPPEVWSFEVGGYRVCEKWLKDRRKEMLSLDDLIQYQRIVTVLAKTILLMDEIDDIIPVWPLT